MFQVLLPGKKDLLTSVSNLNADIGSSFSKYEENGNDIIKLDVKVIVVVNGGGELRSTHEQDGVHFMYH